MQDQLAPALQSSDSTTTTSSSSCLRVKPAQANTTKFKGLVPQSNGHWGAQIYCNHKRIWIGTFKTQEEAAMAYDSAAIKLRSGDSHRNFPWTSLNIHEPDFQNLHSTDTVLKMIRDGSYACKFKEFLNNKNVNNQVGDGDEDQLLSQKNKEGVSRRQLFEKELTVSDVGKLNRLVIPKKYAVKYFPKENDGLELAFYDRLMKEWKFRYCYWTSSQSYVFTRGWSLFVKENGLKAKDVVTFYKCECNQTGANKGSSSYYMIDVVVYDDSNRGGNNGNDRQQCVAPAEIDLCLELTLGKNVQEAHPGGGGGGGGGGGTRLFGVQIG